MASNSTVSLRLKILTEGLQDLIDVTNETGELGDEAERLLDLSKPYVRALQEEARAHAKTSKSLSEKNKELKKVTAAANRAEKELRKTKQQLEEFGKKADLSAKATAQLKTALAGIGVALVAREFVRANSALEQLTRSLTIVEGSAEGGAEQLQFLREEAERLGLRVGELGSEYLKFTAALAGTNLEGEKGREIFTNFAESLANIGADTQRVSLVLTALGQIASKGAISMEELRQQLGDSLPGAVRLLADAIGVSVVELTKLIERGEVSSDRLLEFSRAAAKAYGADGVSAIKTYSAAVGRLGNAIDGLLQKIGNTGAFEALRRTIEASAASIRGLTDLLFGAQKPADDIKDLLSKYDAETGESLKQTAENVKGIADAARGGIPEILELKEVIENLGKSSKGEDLEINLSVDTLERIIETIEKKISDMRLSLRRPLQVDTSEFLSELRQAESEADRFRNLLDLIREKADQAPTGALAGSIAEQTKEAEKEVRRLSDALDRANEAAKARSQFLALTPAVLEGIENYKDQLSLAEERLAALRDRQKEYNDLAVSGGQESAELAFRIKAAYESANEATRRQVDQARAFAEANNISVEVTAKLAASFLGLNDAIDERSRRIAKLKDQEAGYKDVLDQIAETLGKDAAQKNGVASLLLRNQTLQALIAQEEEWQSRLDESAKSGNQSAQAVADLNVFLEENRKKQAELAAALGVSADASKRQAEENQKLAQINFAAAASASELAKQIIAAANAGQLTNDKRLEATKALNEALSAERVIREGNVAATSAQADEQEKVGKRLEFTADAASTASGYLAAMLDSAYGLSQALGDALVRAREMPDQFAGSSDEVRALQIELGRVNERLEYNRRVQSAASDGLKAFAVDADRLKSIFLQQSIEAQKAEEAVRAMAESGQIDMTKLQQASSLAKNGLDLLDSVQLDGLRQAVTEVRREMARLRQEAIDTAEAIERRLLQARGEDAQLAEIEATEELQELQSQLARAQAARDQEAAAALEQAIRDRRELLDIRLQEIEAQRRLTAEQNAQQSSAENIRAANALTDAYTGVSEAQRAASEQTGVTIANLGNLAREARRVNDGLTSQSIEYAAQLQAQAHQQRVRQARELGDVERSQARQTAAERDAVAEDFDRKERARLQSRAQLLAQLLARNNAFSAGGSANLNIRDINSQLSRVRSLQ